jgi:hypothetical protein
MQTDPLAMRSKFRTLHTRTPHFHSTKPASEWAALARVKAEYESAKEVRELLGRILTEDGYRFYSLLEKDPDGGCRIHFFAKPAALSYLEQITGGACGPGDPVDLCPEWLISLVENWP